MRESDSERQPERGLIVFAKEPRPGNVKTRLTTFIDPEDAARLYAAFLGDALDQFAALSVPVHVFVAPGQPDGERLDEKMFGPSTSVRLQRGADLAERLENAFADLFQEGVERLVVIGTDHPTLPSAFIEQAFEALDRRRAVAIGPAEDGGYYLLGLSEPMPALFRGMRFSHAGVFAETLRRARKAGHEPCILPAWYDVDDPAGLHRLLKELRESPDGCNRTRTLLARLHERYGF